MIVCALFVLSGSGYAEAGEPRHMTNESAYSFEEWYGLFLVQDDILKHYRKMPYVAGVELDPLETPVYYGEELFFYWADYFGLGRDSGWLNRSDVAPHVAELLRSFPDAAFRKLPNSGGVLMWDSDAGVRMYMFLSPKGYARPSGFSVLIAEKHEYADFSGLKPGDGVDAVSAIDPVGEIYGELFEILGRDSLNERAEAAGFPMSSIHYLTDGILLIEYKRNAEGEPVIDSLTYSEDYKLTNAFGLTTEYTILPADLPWEEEAEPLPVPAGGAFWVMELR